MGERYTRKQAESAFRALAAALGKSVASAQFRPADAWELDHVGRYGGYVIATVDGRRPFGPTRLRAREFCAACRFAADAPSIAREA